MPNSTLLQRELLVVRLSLWCERWLNIPVLSEAVLLGIVDPVPGSVGYSRAGNRPAGSIVGKVGDGRRPT